MRYLLPTLLLASLVSYIPVFAQPSTNTVQLNASSTPPPTGLGGRVVGLQGSMGIYYWVIARTPSGYTGAQTPYLQQGTIGRNNLTGSNYVTLNWNSVPGATGYDVLTSETAIFPSPCASCAVVLNTASLTVDDTGAALSAYPPVGYFTSVPATSTLGVLNNVYRDPILSINTATNRYSYTGRIPGVTGTVVVGDCPQFGDIMGNLISSGAPCGGGGGAVSSVTAGASGAITASPTTGAVVVDVDTAFVPLKGDASLIAASWSFNSGINYIDDSGAANAYVCTLSPAITSYVKGATYSFKAANANTGASTFNCNGLGAKSIVKVQGGVTTALVANDIRAGQVVIVQYDGTNGQMQSPLGNAASGGSGIDCTLLTNVCIEDSFWMGGTTSQVIGKYGWTLTFQNNSPSVAYSTPTTGHMGGIDFATSAADASGVSTLAANASNVIGLKTATNWTVRSRILTDSATTSMTNLYTGLITSVGQNSIVAIYEPGTSANWLLRVCAAFTCTDVDSTVAYANSTWFDFVIDSTVAGTVGLTVNGSSRVTTSSANVPDVALRTTAVGMNTTSVARTVTVGKWSFYMTGL